ncbi:hypothetical protein Lal_00018749 [Lupinus albus]|nr:hypothetical protein Lal_00018749 [Lupinus albus]
MTLSLKRESFSVNPLSLAQTRPFSLKQGVTGGCIGGTCQVAKNPTEYSPRLLGVLRKLNGIYEMEWRNDDKDNDENMYAYLLDNERNRWFKDLKNRHLGNTINNINQLQIQQFAKWILDVGDGKLSKPNDGYALIEILDSLTISDN